MESVTIFENHLSDSDLFKDTEVYFRDNYNDFVIKELLEMIGEGHSLILPDNKLKKYGYDYCIVFKSKNKGKNFIEIKGKKLAEFLFGTIETMLKNNKEISWEIFKDIILPNNEIDQKISESLEIIKRILSPLSNEQMNTDSEFSKELDIVKMEKEGNLNYAYYILNSLVNELFSSPTPNNCIV